MCLSHLVHVFSVLAAQRVQKKNKNVLLILSCAILSYSLHHRLLLIVVHRPFGILARVVVGTRSPPAFVVQVICIGDWWFPIPVPCGCVFGFGFCFRFGFGFGFGDGIGDGIGVGMRTPFTGFYPLHGLYLLQDTERSASHETLNIAPQGKRMEKKWRKTYCQMRARISPLPVANIPPPSSVDTGLGDTEMTL